MVCPKHLYKITSNYIPKSREIEETKIKKLLLNIAVVFVIILVVSIIMTYLWNQLVYGSGSVDWEFSLVFALTIGIALPLSWALRVKEKMAKG